MCIRGESGQGESDQGTSDQGENGKPDGERIQHLLPFNACTKPNPYFQTGLSYQVAILSTISFNS
jgi:hypothetical protein